MHLNLSRKSYPNTFICDRKLELKSNFGSDEEDINLIFQFFETLPNLKSLKLLQFNLLSRPIDISQLIASLRHAPLLELVLDTGCPAIVEGPPTIGLSGLEKLSITWNNQATGSAHTHLYELIRPSLETLVDLVIDNHLSTDFDLQLLKPAGNTLRSFEYFLASNDEGILDIVPIIFPHLTSLSLRWDFTATRHSILWKVCIWSMTYGSRSSTYEFLQDGHISALAKNQNLLDLTLSSDFEVESGDTIKRSHDDYPWYVRCYKRRLKVTQEVVLACHKLQRCSWIQLPNGRLSSLKHSFVVEERVSDGKKTRVVRGMKQDWMGRNHWNYGFIVKCKSEDLPGDIIGENDSLSDDDDEI